MRTSTAPRVVVLTVVAAVGAAVGAGAATSGAASAAPSPSPTSSMPRTRDPLRWPFARTSIWNTPIGTQARYTPARIRSTIVGVDVDWFVVTRRSDPAVPVYLPASSTEGRCAGRRQQALVPPQARRRQHLPRSFLLPDTPRGVTSAFLQPDRKTLVSYSATARCVPGAALHGVWSGETSLYGDGIAGGSAGSGMSSIGGSIRTDELTGKAPIRHALRLDIGSRYLFYDAATRGRRWPASRADARAAQQYAGTVEALRMGALLALPPGTTAAGLGVRSKAGTKVLAALRDYGGYVVEDSGADAVHLGVEHRADIDFRKRTGHHIQADAGLGADMARIVTALAVVDDNSASAIGGHGTRRAPWAPPLRVPGAPARKIPPTPTAAPAASAIKAGQVAQLDRIGQPPVLTLWALAVAALGLLGIGLWSGRRLAGGARISPRRGP
jgi:hypothetical protein